MIKLMLTLDYEIYGNGEGDLDELVIKPTDRFLELSNDYHARVTIFPDVAEFLAMKGIAKYRQAIKRIENQLCDALRQGHDVQLHLHPQWFGAQYLSEKWMLNYQYYCMARLPIEKSIEFLNKGKAYLENLFKEINPSYRCCAFRAGNWCMMPSTNILKALRKVGIESDSSVFKWGKEKGSHLYYDYSTAYSNVKPWFAQTENINNRTFIQNSILEFPIYTRKVLLCSLVSRKRLFLRRRQQKIISYSNRRSRMKSRDWLDLIFGWHPKKFDFCKLTFSEMKSMLDQIVKYDQDGETIPTCGIGHSKDFCFDLDYENLLKYIAARYSKTIDLENYTSVLGAYKAEYGTPTVLSQQ